MVLFLFNFRSISALAVYFQILLLLDYYASWRCGADRFSDHS